MIKKLTTEEVKFGIEFGYDEPLTLKCQLAKLLESMFDVSMHRMFSLDGPWTSSLDIPSLIKAQEKGNYDAAK